MDCRRIHREKEHKTLEEVAEEYLMELINRSLLQVSRRRSDNKVRAWTIHDLVLDMCWKIAEEETFLFQHQFLISKHHHRLCMNQSHHLSKALSVLYNSEKIRILVAWYDENVDLGIKIMPDLRYLAITYFDSAIGMLQNLEFLRIINIYHQDIPMYLLNMPKLRHLCVGDRVTKSRFNKDCDSFQINNLQTLSFVFISDSKDEEILRCSPNLRMLKCRFFGKRLLDLNFLSQLRSLKMVYESRFRGDYKVFNLPRNIKKLTLSNVGLPWEKMSLIGLLPILEVLKLEDGAFEGKIWDTKDDEFQKLKFLKLVSLDIEQWNSSSNHFPVLKRLVLQFVQKLEMIPSEFSNIPTLQKIEVRYCSESVESSALEIREEQKDYGNEEFELIIQSLRRKESIYCIGVNDVSQTSSHNFFYDDIKIIFYYLFDYFF
ncbi:putative late blight resistance protein homolog R1A-10 [Olea europaea var. sylvestris]|uniref:putative late blight resistance protein homolog R1A-10 n=1 Tax=Olea europaea var. sylvestris TaxID=158386 RepID=UPI000C1D0C68|nr:putative late blight resistance protein homolog R1A-10 [Olea europaea var. sylvestris]